MDTERNDERDVEQSADRLTPAVNQEADADRMPAPEPTPMSAPVQQGERIIAIDALRGFALLGILIMNIRMFAGPVGGYFNPFAYEPSEANERASWLIFQIAHVLADMKMMSIFSMLFGAGIVLMATRQRSKGLGSAGVHYRRMLWLLIIGLLHAYCIWAGDILFMYAWCGMLVYLVYRWYPWVQLIIAVLFMLIGLGINFGAGLTMEEHWPKESIAEMRAMWSPSAEQLQVELDAYRGSWWDQMSQRAPMAFSAQVSGVFFFGLWRAGGMMLLGMALFKWGVFSAARSFKFYIILGVVGLAAGLPIILYGLQRNIADEYAMETGFFLNSQFNYVGSVFVALAWVSAIMLLVKAGVLKLLIRALTAVGQMALTNYLMHSIICTTIFYGHGFGLFGELSYLEQFYVVLAVWAAQLIWSPLWLKTFRFGPFEWLWRSLTYWRPQPLLRT